ncbi:MAG: hypothetical protein PHI73_02495 [Patescibacteria group bacterium]|nr:hypothetical protein [Patescibacteria group bacterium]
MAKRIVFLVIALICLAGFIGWLQIKKLPAGISEVRGKIARPAPFEIVPSSWSEPFVSDRDGTRRIYFYDSAQNSAGAVLPGLAAQLLPVLIDNESLLYFTQESGFYKLWSYSFSEKSNTFLIAISERPVNLTASTDGRLAVYSVVDPIQPGKQRSFIIYLDSRQIKEIGSGISSLNISPNGRRIAYADKEGISVRELIRTDTLSEPFLIYSGEALAPIFSASSEEIIFVKKQDENYYLASGDLRGQAQKEIIALPNIAGTINWTLDLSDDGQSIVYTAMLDEEKFQGRIGQVTLDGGQIQEFGIIGILARWSSKENDIWYNTLELGPAGPRAQIWKMNKQGNYREAITREGNNWLTPLPGAIE